MRYTTTLILAVIVLALAVCIYVFWDQLTGPAKPPEKPAEALPLVKDVRLDDLVSATLEEPAGDGKFKTRMAFKKVEGAKAAKTAGWIVLGALAGLGVLMVVLLVALRGD